MLLVTGGKPSGPTRSTIEVYWKDANSFDSSLGGTYQNCKGSGSFNYSERVMQVNYTITFVVAIASRFELTLPKANGLSDICTLIMTIV